MGRNARMQWRSAVFSADGPDGAVARAVAAALAEFANTETLLAWPSNAQLGACAGVSARSVPRVLARLEAEGWIEKVAPGGVPGGPRTTRWKLTTPRGDGRGQDERPRAEHVGVGDADPAQKVQGSSYPQPAQKVQGSNNDPALSARRPRALSAPTPRSVSPEPVRTSFEPEGVTRSNHLQDDLVQRGSRTELEAALDPIRDRHGTAILTEALQTFHDDQRSYRWPRELAAALDPICSTITARHREAITRQRTAPDPTAITGQAARTRAAAARDALRTPPPETP